MCCEFADRCFVGNFDQVNTTLHRRKADFPGRRRSKQCCQVIQLADKSVVAKVSTGPVSINFTRAFSFKFLSPTINSTAPSLSGLRKPRGPGILARSSK